VSRFRLDPGDPRWPVCLADLAEMTPPCRVKWLWVDGEIPELPGVAVVGARRATAAGMEVARRIGADLGRRGVTVVSGFAPGVDACAHRGCLSAGGRTVAVLGCGLSVDYPRLHNPLRTEVSLRGALVTEYTAWDAPRAWHFPHRNRIIAGLSLAVIVVEAGERSGALSTARWAADLGRDVLAVPGSILGSANAGSNLLLRDGARPFLDVTDLADAFPACADLLPGIDGDPGSSGHAAHPGQAPLRATRLLHLLGAEPVHRELVGQALGMDASDVGVLLGELELAGYIRCLPGGLVARARW
jgi:DNA processing protein